MVVWLDNNRLNTNIMKQLIVKTAIKLRTIIQKLLINYDDETNTIVISNDIPLKIILNGKLHFFVKDDFEIESHGQVDVVTHGSKICLDSLNSQIYLNSRRTNHCLRKIDRFENPNRQCLVDSGGVRHQYERLSYEQLCDKIQELQERIDDFDIKLLENK